MPSPEYATPRKHTRSHSLTTRTRAPEPSITRWTEPSANGSRRQHRREGGPLITGGRGRGSGPALSYRLAFARPGEGGPEERARVVVWECGGGGEGRGGSGGTARPLTGYEYAPRRASNRLAGVHLIPEARPGFLFVSRIGVISSDFRKTSRR